MHLCCPKHHANRGWQLGGYFSWVDPRGQCTAGNVHFHCSWPHTYLDEIVSDVGDASFGEQPQPQTQRMGIVGVAVKVTRSCNRPILAASSWDMRDLPRRLHKYFEYWRMGIVLRSVEIRPRCRGNLKHQGGKSDLNLFGARLSNLLILDLSVIRFLQ